MYKKIQAAPNGQKKKVPAINYWKQTTVAPQPHYINFSNLHRIIGNQAVVRLLKSETFQAQLKTGTTNDVYEQNHAFHLDRHLQKIVTLPKIASPCIQRDTQPKTFADYLSEGAHLFESHIGKGLGFGLAEATGAYDQTRWEQPSSGKAVIRAKVPASEAIAQLVDDVTNDHQVTGPQGNSTYWSVDCLEFTQLLRIYAYWKTLSRIDFDSRFSPLELGRIARTRFGWDLEIWFESNRPGQGPQQVTSSPPIHGIRSPGSPQPFHKTWDDLLRVAPIGTHIQWSNLDLQRRCRTASTAPRRGCNWQNEHTTKVGQDQYAAWDLGVVTADDLKEEMAAAALGGDKRRVTAAYIKANIFIALMEFPEQLSNHTIFKLTSPVDVWGIWQQAPIIIP